MIDSWCFRLVDGIGQYVFVLFSDAFIPIVALILILILVLVLVLVLVLFSFV